MTDDLDAIYERQLRPEVEARGWELVYVADLQARASRGLEYVVAPAWELLEEIDRFRGVMAVRTGEGMRHAGKQPRGRS